MNQEPSLRELVAHQSVPPNVTPAMVWYRFVKELPQLCIICAAGAACIIYSLKNPDKFMEAVAGFVMAAQAAGLIRSKPAEDNR
jgi:hypothetical protein